MIVRKFYEDFRRKQKYYHHEKQFLDEKCVLFLDIDGVLQPTWSQKRFDYDIDALQKAIAELFNDDGYLKIDKYDIAAVFYDWDFVSIGYLKRFLLEFNVDIVLHSSWINHSNLANLKRLFRIHQLDDYLVDLTEKNIGYREDGTSLSKVLVIDEYLEKHPEIDRYVIIDDDRSLAKLGERYVYSPNKIDKETYRKLCETLAMNDSDEKETDE